MVLYYMSGHRVCPVFLFKENRSLFSNVRLRCALAVAGATSLAALMSGCGSDEAKNGADSDVSASGNSSGECPDKHSAKVMDDDGSEVVIDLCQKPATYNGTAKQWAPIQSGMLSGALPLNVNTRDDEAGDGSRDCYKDPSGDKCLPKAGDELKIVCQAKHPNDPEDLYYAILMEGKLFNPTTLTRAGSSEQSSKTSSADDFTNAGDVPVGYLPVDQASAKGSVPECTSKILHDQEARRKAAMEQQLPITQ